VDGRVDQSTGTLKTCSAYINDTMDTRIIFRA
jgi:hypothetical protein